jgi:hypothetical protein
MTKKEVKKILLGLIYTPDAKPRFVGGDLDKKLQLIDDTAAQIVALHHESDEVKNASHYLSNTYNEVAYQLEKIKGEMDGSKLIDYVDGVLVWEKVAMQFTCDEFLELIS